MKPIYQVLVSEYYRRNTLFFGLLLIVFAVVMRPAYLIVSPMITRPILENNPVFASVVGFCTLYLIKCLIETLAALRQPENRFIYMLAVQSRVYVFGAIFLVFLAISAPAIFYLLVLMVYAFIWGFWHGVFLSVYCLLTLSLCTVFLTYRIIHPKMYPLSFPLYQRIEAVWKGSWTYLGMSSLWFRFKKKVFFHKTIALGIMGGLASFHLANPLSDKGLRLSLWAIACFQCILSYRYQQATVRSLFILKSLPVPRFRRWIAYGFSGLLLFLPETVLASTLSPSLSTWSFLGSYWLISTCVFCLGIAILHYDAPELTIYLGWGFGLFCVGFFITLFGVPLWMLSLAIFLFATWIFWEEFYRSEVRFPEE